MGAGVGAGVTQGAAFEGCSIGVEAVLGFGTFGTIWVGAGVSQGAVILTSCIGVDAWHLQGAACDPGAT